MIYVTQLRRTKAWDPGVSCMMFSDASREELFDFAGGIGLTLPALISELGRVPWFELGPRYRKRAVSAGATSIDRGSVRAALARYRSRDREDHRRYVESLR